MRVALLIGLVGLLSAGCTADPSAQYFHFTGVAATPPPTVDISTTAAVAAHTRILLRGQTTRPNLSLTPGFVATTNVGTVCAGAKKEHALFSPKSPLISPADIAAVFAEYKISVANERHYGLDFLVPLQLGGANTKSNIWPALRFATNRGAGFREKETLNIRLHVLVCHGQMKLADAQTQVASDWISLWVRYGA